MNKPMNLRPIILSIAVIAAYFITGVFGLKLAVAPSYTSPIFPPSGIALAALIILGRKYFPAIFLGSMLMNFYVRYQNGVWGPDALIISSLIALGATIQALLGHALTNKIVSKNEGLRDEKDIFLFLFFAGPCSCLINATLSVTALSFFNVFSSSTFFYNWVMWFVGDAIGAMVFTPIVLAIVEAPTFSMNMKKRLAVYPSLFLFGLIVWLFFFSSEQLSEKFRNTLQNESQLSANNVDEAMNKYAVILESVERLFSSSKEVTRYEYQEFLKDSLTKYPGIRAISWNPIVKDTNRKKMESLAKEQGFKNFRIFDGEHLNGSPKRDQYIPVFYVQPMTSNEKAIGYDTYQSPVRRNAMERTILKRDISITPKLQLIQDTTEIPSIAMYYPVFSKTNQAIIGFIVGTFKLENLITASIQDTKLKGISYLVYDVTDNKKELLFKQIEKGEELEKVHEQDIFVSKKFEIGGRQWVFEIFPSKQYSLDHADLTAWSMLLGGLLLVILLQSLMMIILGRTATIQTLVDQKTHELSEANAELEEIAKMISQDLEESNLNFKQLAESMPQIVWVLDDQGKGTYINTHWESYTGYKMNEVGWADVIHPDDLEKTREIWSKSLANGTNYEAQYRILSKAGYYRWFLVRGITVKDDKGQNQKWYGTCTDIHEQIIAEEEKTQLIIREKSATEASKLKSAFLANMSHEIRTPINGVVGMTGLLKDTALNEEQAEFAKNIEISANSLLYVINDILDFSKVEAGKLDLEIIDFDFEQTALDTFKTIEFLAKKKGISLISDLKSMPSKSLKGDPGRLGQVLTNLLNNAIKFTEAGKVTLRINQVSSTSSKLRYRFEVEDSGIGISEKAIDKIFQPFDQEDSSTTRRFGGTGLGLSISKHLVELMKGNMGVKSTLGTGSTFWFEIEFEQGLSELHDLRHLEKAPIATKSNGIRILLAEDNQINQVVATKQLAKIGCHCDTVANGQEAIEALKNLPYDLVLMDCQMPEMDGYEATRLIRSMNAPFSKIPIIAMTANAMKGDREKCLEAGMNDYVTKPISVSALSKVIENWLHVDVSVDKKIKLSS
jgi:PAS domain S-box-containing protein